MSFLDKLDDFSEDLREASIWHRSESILAEVEIENQCDASGDFIYELYCLFRIIKDLSIKYRIRIVKGSGLRRFKFPRKPAPKLGWPRFEVLDVLTNEVLLQVCAGTFIKSEAIGENRAPDISFQSAKSPEEPTESDVFCIYDAKFNEGRKKSKLSESEYAKVLMMVSDLRLNTGIPITLPVDFQHLTSMDANCAITNGEAWTLNHTRHKHNCLRVLYHFSEEYESYNVVGI